MTDTIYFLTTTLRNETETRAIIHDQMESYEPAVYREDIQNLGLNEVAHAEWANVWTPNNTDTFETREAAEKFSQEAYERPGKIVEITLEDVKEALTSLFGDDE